MRRREDDFQTGFGLRFGERGKWSGGGEKLPAKRSGAERPAAVSQTEALRSCVENTVAVRDERAVCGAERASSKGNGATGSPCSEANRALVTASLRIHRNGLKDFLRFARFVAMTIRTMFMFLFFKLVTVWHIKSL